MKFLSIIPLLASLLGLFPAIAAAQQPIMIKHSAPLPDDAIILPFTEELGKINVSLKINGSGPYRFIFDTGAQMTVIDKSLFEELDLKSLGKVASSDAAGLIIHQNDQLSLQDVTLGEARYKEVDAISAEVKAMFGDMLDPPAGILSYSLFADKLLTIDYENKQLVLTEGELPSPDGKSILALQRSILGHPAIDISVAGTTYLATIDTGAPHFLSMPSELIESLPLRSDPVDAGGGQLMNTSFTIKQAHLAGSLQIGPAEYTNPAIIFNDVIPEVHLGAPSLSACQITIDQKNQRVRLVETGAGSPSPQPKRRVMMNPPSNQKRYGIRISPGPGGSISIIGTDPGSPAEKAGLLSGDKILQMNGTPISELDMRAQMAIMRTSPVTLIIEREGKSKTIEMTLD